MSINLRKARARLCGLPVKSKLLHSDNLNQSNDDTSRQVRTWTLMIIAIYKLQHSLVIHIHSENGQKCCVLPKKLNLTKMSGRGKAAKGGKSSSKTRSMRAGLQFPVGRIHRFLRKGWWSKIFEQYVVKLSHESSLTSKLQLVSAICRTENWLFKFSLLVAYKLFYLLQPFCLCSHGHERMITKCLERTFPRITWRQPIEIVDHIL